ncbi:YdbL family protein [Methylophaga sp. OBS4]|uniref:YdbL family protein n=1 Tax=Methylophaga sp. OBS4 TaxID=2991935 RepID=UPI0022551BF4|nr:YdbL family protein [Methylophaga sp. OBS4]MCX4186451.1 YdbL family protein [Methylophaga sp. OBS4]
MNLFKWLTGTVSGLMLVSCVTINIYFPAAAAEKAADRIIEDVWGPETRPPQQPQAEPEQEQSSALELTPASTSVAVSVLNWLIPQAAAAEANININSPAINALQSQMKARHDQLKPFYDSGAVGLTDDGLITVRDAKAISLKDRNKVNGLVADENKDRKALYAEIARANGHPEWQDDIQETFARRWIGNAAKGWWYQQGGNWKQK